MGNDRLARSEDSDCMKDKFHSIAVIEDIDANDAQRSEDETKMDLSGSRATATSRDKVVGCSETRRARQ